MKSYFKVEIKLIFLVGVFKMGVIAFMYTTLMSEGLINGLECGLPNYCNLNHMEGF